MLVSTKIKFVLMMLYILLSIVSISYSFKPLFKMVPTTFSKLTLTSFQNNIKPYSYSISAIHCSISPISKYDSQNFKDISKNQIIKRFTSFIVYVAAFFTGTTKALAKDLSVTGWDLFGRVPYDNFLFKTSVLTNPNFLKRSFIETVVSEIPDVISNQQRRKGVFELVQIFRGTIMAVCVLLLFGFLFKFITTNNLRMRKNTTTISAITKNSARKGKLIEDMGEGWYDMEQMEEEVDDDDKEPDSSKGKKK